MAFLTLFSRFLQNYRSPRLVTNLIHFSRIREQPRFFCSAFTAMTVPLVYSNKVLHGLNFDTDLAGNIVIDDAIRDTRKIAKMYCCARQTFYCREANEIQFGKLNTKYSLDEDIIVYYTLRDNVRTSTRDWVGIFPRGWTNLQQYLTFEYAVVPPNAALYPDRSIVFAHTFHREASPALDYQFVYVSREIEILGTSPYFRFTIPAEPLVYRIERMPECIVPADSLPVFVTLDREDTRSCLSQNAAPEKILGVVRRSSKNRVADHRQRMCRACCATKLAPTIAANRVQFLLSHNEKLLARVGRLERDLELAETAVKHEKMAQTSLLKRLQAYENFVSEMFRCLNLRGIVKICDKTGKEIIIRRMKRKELSFEHCEQSDKISNISMLNQPSDCRTFNLARAAEENKFHPVADKPVTSLQNLSAREPNKNDKLISQSAENEIMFAETHTVPDQGTESAEVALSVEDNLPEQDKKISGTSLSAVDCAADSQGERCRHEIKAVVDRSIDGTRTCDNSVSNQDALNLCVKKVAENNNFETKIENGADKRIEEEVSLRIRTLNSPKSNTDSWTPPTTDEQSNSKDWVLECECDLEISNRIYQEINSCTETLKCCPRIRVINDPASGNVTDAISSNAKAQPEDVDIDIANNEVPQSKPSAILIKGRNAKFAIIRY